MRLKVNVTKNAIRTGIRCDETSCAIAKALQVSLRKKKVAFTDVDVTCGPAGVAVSRMESNPLIGTLPLQAEVFVVDFDGGVPKSRLKPFSFSLDLR
ncbi:MAG TPA: hypothetical protein VFO62_05915 [Candidatus Binatia bacterium]|nr:hypothetical protein [Candidatus Binatia bacterium]